MSRVLNFARSVVTLLQGFRTWPVLRGRLKRTPSPAAPGDPLADRQDGWGSRCFRPAPADTPESPPAKVCVIQADNRPVTIHRESKPLTCDPADDTAAMMRSFNAGALGRTWDYWSSSFVINRLKCRITGCRTRSFRSAAATTPTATSPGRRSASLRTYMRDHPEIDVVAFLDSDAFIRDEEHFRALVDALVAAPDKHGVLSRDPHLPKNTYINTGCMILKNDAFGRGFLDAVWSDADRNPRYRREWPHEQFAASAFVLSHREAFFVCRTAVLNTPCGQIVRHSWWKELFFELVDDEFKATVAKLCFSEPERSAAARPFDLSALLDP